MQVPFQWGPVSCWPMQYNMREPLVTLVFIQAHMPMITIRRRPRTMRMIRKDKTNDSHSTSVKKMASVARTCEKRVRANDD